MFVIKSWITFAISRSKISLSLSPSKYYSTSCLEQNVKTKEHFRVSNKMFSFIYKFTSLFNITKGSFKLLIKFFDSFFGIFLIFFFYVFAWEFASPININEFNLINVQVLLRLLHGFDLWNSYFLMKFNILCMLMTPLWELKPQKCTLWCCRCRDEF